jgi:hypothetical protein
MITKNMSRKDFLKKLGIAALVVASIPAVIDEFSVGKLSEDKSLKKYESGLEEVTLKDVNRDGSYDYKVVLTGRKWDQKDWHIYIKETYQHMFDDFVDKYPSIRMTIVSDSTVLE